MNHIQEYTITCNECMSISNFTLDNFLTNKSENIVQDYLIDICNNEEEKICKIVMMLFPFVWSYFRKFVGSYEICEMISACS